MASDLRKDKLYRETISWNVRMQNLRLLLLKLCFKTAKVNTRPIEFFIELFMYAVNIRIV
jgi:hypothetical protein